MFADWHVAAENLAVILASLLVAGIYLPRALGRPEFDHTARILAGVSLTAIGLALHRGWWAAWRMTDKDGWFVDWSWAATTPAILLVLAGYYLHISAYLIERYGDERVAVGAYATLLATAYLAGLVLAWAI